MKAFQEAARFLVGVVFCFFCSLQAIAVPNDLMGQLQSKKQETRKQATRHILEERRQLIQSLIALAEPQINDLESSQSKVSTAAMPSYLDRVDATASIIVLIGQLHAEEAVPFLLKHLAFRDANQSVHDGLLKEFPCVGALVNIGTPSLEPLMQKLTETDQVKVAFGGIILVKALGRNTAIAYVQERLNQQREPVQKQRLGRLLKYLQELPEGVS